MHASDGKTLTKKFLTTISMFIGLIYKIYIKTYLIH